MDITEEELELCSYVIPKKQLEFTLELSKGEEGTFFTNKLKEIAQKVKEITTDEDLYNEDYTHNVGFRYFLGNTEIYCSQLYPDPENPSRPDGYGFGYVILNGDTQMSEWGNIYLPEFKDIPFMEMDYHVPKNITIEEMLYKRHPDDFKNPNEVSDISPIYKKENNKKLTVKEDDIYTIPSDPGLTEEQYYETKYLTEKLIRPFIDDKTRKSELVEAFNNLEKHGVLDIVGKKIDVQDGQISEKGWQELGTALHIYQDKHYETMRYLFVDTENGEIKHQLALTSKIPNISLVSKEDTIPEVISKYENTHTKIVLCHNHPSGNINPSLLDLSTTEKINDYFTHTGKNNLLGHIILDHNKFNVFNAKTNSWNKFESLTNENNYEYNKDFPFKKDSKLSSTLYLEEVAKEINDTNNYNDKYIPFIYINYDFKINGIQYFHVDRINKSSESLKKDVKESILKGNYGAFPIIPDTLYNSLSDKQKENLEKNLAKHVKNGVFVDAYLNNNSISKKYRLENKLFDIAGKLSPKDIRNITEVTSTFKPEINPYLFENKDLNYEVKWESDFDKTYTDNKNPINIVFKSSREALQFQYDFLEKTGEKLNIYYTYKEPTHVYNHESKLIEKKENIPEYKNQKAAVKYIASKLDEAYKTSNNEEINADVRQMQASYIIESLSNYCEQHKEKLSHITDLPEKVENELFENGNECLKGHYGTADRERGLVIDGFKENEMKIINGNYFSVSEPELQYVKLSQDDIDFYRNTAIVREEIENGVVNVLYRKDKESNELYAIFPEHKYTEKDWWEYRDENGNSKAIDPDCLEKETARPSETELKKFKEKIQKEIFSDFEVKQNVYSDLQDVPYFKDKQIKNLEEVNKKLSEQIEFLKTQNKQFVDSFEKTHSETQKQNNEKEKISVNQNKKELIHQNVNTNSKKRGR